MFGLALKFGRNICHVKAELRKKCNVRIDNKSIQGPKHVTVPDIYVHQVNTGFLKTQPIIKNGRHNRENNESEKNLIL